MVTVTERTGEPLFGAALMFTVLVPELKLRGDRLRWSRGRR